MMESVAFCLAGLALAVPALGAHPIAAVEVGIPPRGTSGPDGLFRPSHQLPGTEEAYLPLLAPSSHATNLLLLKSGDLLCTWFTGTYEGESGVGIAVSRLPRNGSRWSRPTMVDRRVGESFQNPVPFEAPDGSIWIFHTTQPAGRGESHARVLFTRSTDGGRTWTPPRLLLAESGVFIRQPLLILPDGGWLLPIYFTPQLGPPQAGWEGAENDHCAVAISDDHGLHWSEHPIPESSGLVQPDVIRLRDGHYRAFFRSRYADHIYVSASDDGSTWTAPRPTPLPNNNSSIQVTELPDGKYALAFNNSSARTHRRRAQSAPRWPLSVALSEDQGRTWPWIRDLETGENYPHSNSPPPAHRPGGKEYSYPSIRSGSDGKLYIAYTYLRTTIKVVRFDEKWPKGGSTSGLIRGQ